MGRCKDPRKADCGRKMKQYLEHEDWDVRGRGKHYGATHKDYDGTLFFSFGRISIGVNRQIVKVLAGMGMAGMLLAIVYMYT